MTLNAQPHSCDYLLDTKDAASVLGLSALTLCDWRCKGHGPRFVKIGHRSVRYRMGDLQAWLNDRVYGSTAEAKEGVR